MQNIKSELDTAPQLRVEAEPVEDFLRNFLMRSDMQRTMQAFQQEWYELMREGRVKSPSGQAMPNVYRENVQLQDRVAHLLDVVENLRHESVQVQTEMEKLRKERDYHRMHHRRILQDKAGLVGELKREQQRAQQLQSENEILRDKRAAALRSKMLARIQRDQAQTELQATLRRTQGGTDEEEDGADEAGVRTWSDAPLRSENKSAAVAIHRQPPAIPSMERTVKETPMPPLVPDLSTLRPSPDVKPMKASRIQGLTVVNTIAAHELAVSSIALHPDGETVASVGDDGMLKHWTLPSGQLDQAVSAHRDWIATVRFNQQGTILATASGDSSIRLWDAVTFERIATLSEHAHAVWTCDFHYSGDFLVSGAMDNTLKVWDLNTLRCRQTMRGHTDSVNCVRFQPMSNFVLSGSADATVKLWDARTGLLVRTFVGHENAINGITFNPTGEIAASCDAEGVCKVWSMASGEELLSIHAGPHPANCVALDSSGSVVALGANDGLIRVFDVETGELICELQAHEDAVQSLEFEHMGNFLLSSSADGTVRLWS